VRQGLTKTFARLDSLTEVILLLVLVSNSGKNGADNIPVIKAAILGSMLATMLLCLGLCFFVAGLRRDVSSFSETVGETGSALLCTA
jgi:Ca2+:H+ antiporter